METTPEQVGNFQPRLALWAGYASMGVVCILITIKAVVYGAGGSASILASLVDSIVDGAVSLISFLAIRESLKPADKNHRHGHGKIEGLAALMQAAFIAGSAVFLALEAFSRLVHPQDVQGYGLGVVVMVISTILSVLLVLFQRAILRRAPSLAVKADSAHYSSDILINMGVIAALLAQASGAPVWIDSLFAVGVAVWLLRTVFTVGRGGVDMLLDRELPKDVREKIKTIAQSDPRVRGLHDLRTRMVGMNMNVSFDIDVDPELTLIKAHDIAVDVERALLRAFPNAEIMIHVDPLGEPSDSRHSVAGVHH